MNRIQRLSAALALTLVFALPAFAEGQIPTGPGAAPPSARAAISTEGDMDCPIIAPDGADAAFTETVLNLLEGMLALL